MAFFKPLNTVWRKIITECKDSPAGRTKTFLDKQHFHFFKQKKKLSVPAGKSVSIEDLEKFNEGYDIATKNLVKRKKQTLNMNTIKTKLQSEESPKECHDHSSSLKAFSNKKKSEKSSSKKWTSVQREERGVCCLHL